jgi:hypothetical protein
VRKADLATSALLLVCSLAFSAGALKYYEYWGDGGPGPSFLPFWLGIVMALLAVARPGCPSARRATACWA